MIKALFIVNCSNDIIYQKNYGKTIDKGVLVPFYDKLTTIPIYNNIPPVINCNTYCLFHFCHELPSNSVYFIAVTDIDVPPLFISSFLQRIRIILKYCYPDGSFNDNTLKQDYIRLIQIMDQLADGGFPFITEPNTIDALLNENTTSQKIEKAVLGELSVNYDKDALGSRTLPWRKDGVIHKTNEILFDVNERISTVFNLVTGKASRTEVLGEVICISSLSGIPDVTLRFDNPQIMDDVSFHPCVRIGKWEQQKVLSFIPPDGKFTLFNYRVRGTLQAPIKLGGSVKYTSSQGLVELSVYGNNIAGFGNGPLKSELINQQVVIEFPVSVTSCQLVVNTGKYIFDGIKHVLIWNIGKHDPKIIPTISGTVNRSMYEDTDTFTKVSMNFQIINYAASGLRFKHLDCNQPYQLRKGVKFTTYGGRYLIKV
ncbi:clathrin-adaptor medium chain, putative [Entamoeba nuttalli P19]|uniref:Clathrin-adaptor medium chain, putative n=1 Tax=Entamoeba nuttalli (strain P19) TaxID=1076696 RepID=K2H4U3_ENTNP|nr:clathrin-adaptor medium chain, putative [Entamoeba nuttalli P19]EKE42563.1 clathrin-adaptor medium chain, putative [Entamoeba nuttalli P19]|eukprot:XP_008855102.1 clathrin-adaptor medium chain, putative [Entamoeba nuttalli P19]